MKVRSGVCGSNPSTLEILFMTDVVTRLELPDEFIAARPQLFPSAESFSWFVRKNRDELVRTGALTRPTGRWLVQPEAFDQAVATIGARRAIRA